jgi:hypothetical protein
VRGRPGRQAGGTRATAGLSKARKRLWVRQAGLAGEKADRQGRAVGAHLSVSPLPMRAPSGSTRCGHLPRSSPIPRRASSCSGQAPPLACQRMATLLMDATISPVRW